MKIFSKLTLLTFLLIFAFVFGAAFATTHAPIKPGEEDGSPPAVDASPSTNTEIPCKFPQDQQVPADGTLDLNTGTCTGAPFDCNKPT